MSVLNVDYFRRNGYQVFRNLLPAEVTNPVGDFLRNVSQRAIAAAIKISAAGEEAQLSRTISAMVANGSFSALAHSEKQLLSGHLPLESRLDPILWKVPRHPALLELLREVLASERLFMHMPPTARFVLPHHSGAVVPAHRDASYNRHMSEFVTVWVPFVEIDDECGGVVMYEGEGAFSEVDPEQSESFWLRGVETTGLCAVRHSMNVGDVLVLNRWVVHKSAPNRSNRTRLSVDFRFLPDTANSTKHVLDLQMWDILENTSQRAIA